MTCPREGDRWPRFLTDLSAGMTAAVTAPPLAMARGIGSIPASAAPLAVAAGDSVGGA